jgi:hypothetical protein
MTNSGMFETYRPVSLGIGYRGRLLPLVCASPERPSTGRLSMSAFGSEADALAHPSKSPLIARRRHCSHNRKASPKRKMPAKTSNFRQGFLDPLFGPSYVRISGWRLAATVIQ